MKLTFQERLARIEQIHAMDREDGLAVFDGLRAEGNHAQEVRAISGVVQSKLQDFAVHLRHPDLTPELSDCGELLYRYVVRAREALRLCGADPTLERPRLFAGEFSALFHAALLVCAFEAAEEFAQTEREPWVIDNEVAGGPEGADLRDISARLTAAAVRRDAIEVAAQELRWSRQAQGRFFFVEYEWIYVRLQRMTVERDHAGLDLALAKADELFQLKCIDRRLKSELETHDQPEFAVDYRAAALANLALRHGLRPSYSSPTLPRIG